jgi:hypothetical protein
MIGFSRIDRRPSGMLGMAVAVMVLAGCSSEGEVITSHPVWAFDINDPAALAEEADAIFVGTVLEKGDVVDLGTNVELPFTEYTIRVDESLKGDLSGETVFLHEGGTVPNGDTYVTEGIAPVEIGEQYVLAGHAGEDGRINVWPVGAGDPADEPAEIAALASELETVLD